MKAGWLLSLALAGAVPAAAEEAADAGATPVLRPAQVRLGAERIELPAREHLGLVGTTYLLRLTPGLWVGPAAYGAISGQRGGLFTVGGEIAWRQAITGPLAIEAGLYAGGGGGGSAPVGGGLMLRPHVDLLWDLGGHRVGLSWSRVRFADSPIDSRQLGLVWSTDTDFVSVPAARLDAPATWTTRSGVGLDRVQAVVGAYRPRGGAVRLSGGALPSTIGFAGTRLERALGDSSYWGIEAAGAASGGVAGYAEYLATLGTEARWGRDRTVGARLALGMGGGGDVDVGGGLLIKAGVYGIARLAEDLGLTLEAGLAKAPQGSFQAAYGSVALNWALDESGGRSTERSTRMEWVGGFEQYRAARRDGSERSLKAVTLRINRYLGPEFYLSGQAHSAYDGGAGGYSVGLLGLGWQKALGARWQVGAEAVIGAAGGGGVDTAGGLITQTMVHAGYEVLPGVSLRLGGGRLQALRGPLSATVVEAALSFGFGVKGDAVR